MDKYKKLVSNTVIFAIGTFSSKLLVFLLMPLYTRVLSESDYGVVDLLMQTGNLLLPLVSLGINNAIIRFGLDKSSDSREVFTG
ncbi:MAG: lipopolysaccharide biosynthesis protein, partial [Christensenellaceae bacterium]